MASRSFSLPLPHRPLSRTGPRGIRVPRPRPRLVAAVLAVVVLLGGGWHWLRDASLFDATQVTVDGASGSQAAAVTDALQGAAHDMTTMHVRQDVLRRAVAAYPIVAGVRATGHFPHRLDITVIQRTPVAALRAPGGAVAVASDETLLRGSAVTGLPVIAVASAPGGTRLSDPLARAQVRILAAAPAALRAHVTRSFTGARGLELQLENGPAVAFGAPVRLAAKWAALVAVLADPASAGGTLIDLSVPERPAVAGLEPLPGATTDGAAAAAGAGTTSGNAPGTSAGTAPASSTAATPAAPAPAAAAPGPSTTAQPPTTP